MQSEETVSLNNSKILWGKLGDNTSIPCGEYLARVDKGKIGIVNTKLIVSNKIISGKNGNVLEKGYYDACDHSYISLQQILMLVPIDASKLELDEKVSPPEIEEQTVTDVVDDKFLDSQLEAISDYIHQLKDIGEDNTEKKQRQVKTLNAIKKRTERTLLMLEEENEKRKQKINTLKQDRYKSLRQTLSRLSDMLNDWSDPPMGSTVDSDAERLRSILYKIRKCSTTGVVDDEYFARKIMDYVAQAIPKANGQAWMQVYDKQLKLSRIARIASNTIRLGITESLDSLNQKMDSRINCINEEILSILENADNTLEDKDESSDTPTLLVVVESNSHGLIYFLQVADTGEVLFTDEVATNIEDAQNNFYNSNYEVLKKRFGTIIIRPATWVGLSNDEMYRRREKFETSRVFKPKETSQVFTPKIS